MIGIKSGLSRQKVLAEIQIAVINFVISPMSQTGPRQNQMSYRPI